MKKTLVLMCILILAAACNKSKKYSNDLAGTWTVYKYLLNNVDQTASFKNRLINYSISFTSGGTFKETYGTPSDTSIGGLPVPDTAYISNSGSYSFTDQTSVIVLTDTLRALVDSVWVTTGNVRQYQIFDITTMDVQFVNDTSRLYMSKNK